MFGSWCSPPSSKRLWGAAEASWVSSILIQPRQHSRSSPFSGEDLDCVTASKSEVRVVFDHAQGRFLVLRFDDAVAVQTQCGICCSPVAVHHRPSRNNWRPLIDESVAKLAEPVAPS